MTSLRSSLLTPVLITILLAACSRPDQPPVEEATPVEEPTQITIGEVSAADDPAGPGAAEALRDALRRGALDLERSTSLERQMVLVGGVSRIERSPAGGGIVVRVTVSVALQDRNEGQILVMLESTAQATGPQPESDVERDELVGQVVEGAAQDALSRLGARLEEL